jgi:hypothetical protein
VERDKAYQTEYHLRLFDEQKAIGLLPLRNPLDKFNKAGSPGKKIITKFRSI